MNTGTERPGAEGTSRRDFIRTAAAAMPALTLAGGGGAFAAGSDIIRVGVIGCGNRGSDAILQALNADKGARWFAAADIVLDRIKEARTKAKEKFPGQVTLDDDHCFTGFDAYKKVIEASDVVLIANAAKFHPLYTMTAIQAGRHVFVEKPHGIDPAGIKLLRAACELAKEKKLCVVSGLQSRFWPGYQETIKRIHDGAIGDIVTVQETWLRPPYVLYPRRPGLTEVEHQASNQYHFYWLCGDDVPQTLVHNLDRARWAMKEAVPLKCWAMGGRSTLHGEIYGSTFDHNAVVYEFASGVRLYAYCRTIDNCYDENSSILFGTKGRAFVTDARIEGETKWSYARTRKQENPYQLEHDALFKAIRTGNPINSGYHMADSTLMGIIGQLSSYTGKPVTWEQAASSDFYYAPRPEEVRADMEPPVKPDKDGLYPAFTPGVTKFL